MTDNQLFVSKQYKMKKLHGPLQANRMYLTDGGFETTLIFHHGMELRYFAAFELLNTTEGRERIRNYYQPYLEIASKYHTGFILETPTWRANPDWGYKMGYTHSELMAINTSSVNFIRELVPAGLNEVIISGNIGPRGDGYKVESKMSAEEAYAYHFSQVQAFAGADVDVITALTMNYAEEAIGIIKAAAAFQMPCVISFTVETNGALPSGQSLQEAIEQTDNATDHYTSYYMLNCAHPEHFKKVLDKDAPWMQRIKGIRANASTKSHAELDEATELDRGDVCGLAADYAALKNNFPALQVFGGCCGTDHHHLGEICKQIFEVEEVIH